MHHKPSHILREGGTIPTRNRAIRNVLLIERQGSQIVRQKPLRKQPSQTPKAHMGRQPHRQPPRCLDGIRKQQRGAPAKLAVPYIPARQRAASTIVINISKGWLPTSSRGTGQFRTTSKTADPIGQQGSQPTIRPRSSARPAQTMEHFREDCKGRPSP